MSLRALLLAALAFGWGGQIAAAGQPVTMWLAEGDTNRVYLLGSIHLLRQSDYPLPAVISAAYEDAEALVMELDMDDLDAAAVQQLTRELGLLPPDRELRDVLGEAQYGEALAAAEALDIPLEMLARTEPWLAAMTIEQMMLARIGFNPLHGVEMFMTRKAIEDGKPITGLEEVSEQLRFLDGLEQDAQVELLLQTLEESRQLESLMDDVIAAWRIGDTDFLETSILAEMRQYPELYDSIVAERNRRWIASLEDLLDDEEDYLVIVGALHLVGDDGVPALLEKRGIPVRQMHETF
jgi:hypothetical protein